MSLRVLHYSQKLSLVCGECSKMYKTCLVLIVIIFYTFYLTNNNKPSKSRPEVSRALLKYLCLFNKLLYERMYHKSTPRPRSRFVVCYFLQQTKHNRPLSRCPGVRNTCDPPEAATKATSSYSNGLLRPRSWCGQSRL